MIVKHYRLRDTGNTSDQSWQRLGIVSVYAMEVQESKNRWKHLQDGSSRKYAYGLEQGKENFRYHAHQHNIHAYQIDGIDDTPVIAVPNGYEIVNLYDSAGAGNTSPQYYKPIKLGSKDDFRFYGDFTNEDGSVKVFAHYKHALEFVRERAGEQDYPYDDYRAW